LLPRILTRPILLVGKVLLMNSLSLAFSLSLALLAADPALPAAPAAENNAFDLVRRLGSESYRERELASEQLLKLGLAARPALEQGLTDADLEIRHRCEDILPAVMEVDFKNRIAAFLADKDGKGDYNVPQWRYFRKVAGSDPAARQLFCEMLQGDTLSLLRDCSDHAGREGEVLERYLRHLQQKMYQPFAGRPPGQFGRAELAAVLFIGGLDPASTGRQLGPYIICNMLYQQAARNAVLDGPAAPVLKTLLLRWMRNQTNEQVVMQLGQIIQNLNLKEGQTFLAEVIKEKRVRGFILAHVVISLARVGGKEQVPVLESLLSDETTLGRIQLNTLAGDTQIKDVALGMLVHLTGQSHKDYGFSFLAEQPALLWAPNYLGFSTQQQREAAHKKWKDWVVAQKK
jgi:hypothetical protein